MRNFLNIKIINKSDIKTIAVILPALIALIVSIQIEKKGNELNELKSENSTLEGLFSQVQKLNISLTELKHEKVSVPTNNQFYIDSMRNLFSEIEQLKQMNIQLENKMAELAKKKEVLNEDGQNGDLSLSDNIEIPDFTITQPENRSIEEKYKAAISKADSALYAKNDIAAKEFYEEALAIKPAESHPENQLRKINSILYNDIIYDIVLGVNTYISTAKYDKSTQLKLTESLNSLYKIKLTTPQNRSLEKAIAQIEAFEEKSIKKQEKEVKKRRTAVQDSINKENKLKEEIQIKANRIIEQVNNYKTFNREKHEELIKSLSELQSNNKISTEIKEQLKIAAVSVMDIYVNHYIEFVDGFVKKTDFERAFKELYATINEYGKYMTPAQKDSLKKKKKKINEKRLTAKKHSIKETETLYSISNKYNVPVEKLIQLNKSNKDALRIRKIQKDTIIYLGKTLIIRE